MPGRVGCRKRLSRDANTILLRGGTFSKKIKKGFRLQWQCRFSSVSWGEHPEDGDGEVRIKLTLGSEAILEKVPKLKKWNVQHPMIRGSNAAAKGHESSVKRKRNTLKIVRKGKSGNGKKKSKKTKKAPELHTDDLGEKSFHRNRKGREAVQLVCDALKALDEKAFPNSTAFTAEGRCRMKFEGADALTWEMLIGDAPKAFESMCRGMRGGRAVGKGAGRMWWVWCDCMWLGD